MKRFANPRLHIICALLMVIAGILTLAIFTRTLPTFTSKASSSGIKSASLIKSKVNGYNDAISVQLQEGNHLPINLRSGRTLLTNYVGSATATEALRDNQAEALALASEDFDEDGIKDIIAAYAATGGAILTLQRGNPDAIYPNTPEAQQRKADGTFTDAAFMAEAQAMELAQRPDFIGAGDFDGDGHQDLVIATAKDNKLTYLSGDGKGNFTLASQVDLTGYVTALECADVNRRDGLADVLVGINGNAGAKAVIFESPLGAMQAKAEIIDLPDAASAFAVGNLDEDYPVDIAIAAGKELLLVKGHDRKLTAGETAQVKAPYIKHRSFAGKIRSVIAGQFSDAKGMELALLTDDGSILIIEKTGKTGISGKVKKIASRDFPAAERLTGARVTNSSTENLLTLDSSKRQLHILSTAGTVSGKGKKKVTLQANSYIVTQMDVDGEPVAALPMRLNADSLSDLVILRRGQSAITVTPSSTQANFMVTSAADDGPGSFREALELANANPDADLITFNLGVLHTIDLLSPLPAIQNPVTIDATTQPGFTGLPIIELNFSGAGNTTAGLDVNSTGCTIRGFIIHGLIGKIGQGNGIRIFSDGTIVEGNFIGTNATGTATLSNSGIGVRITNASMVTIGGTTQAARNLISGNMAAGIELLGIICTSNSIIGNFIGTDLTGTTALGNMDGIDFTASPTGNTVGGLTAGHRNVISGNVEGISISGMGNLVQGNYIGVDSTGSVDLGNTGDGVLLSDAQGTTVGGVVAGARNVISGNNNAGILLNGANEGFIQGNFIGLNAAGVGSIPNSMGGIRVFDGADNLIGGTVAAAANTIAFNLDSGIRIIMGINNAILGNSIFSNDGLGINLGDDGVTANDLGDLDGGPNNFQNFPTLESASQEGGSTRIIGTLQSESLKQYRVEFFSNASCDPSGNGEGERFLGATTVATDAAGEGAYNVLLPSVPAGQAITATATATGTMDNNTSEYSACVSVIGVAGTADLSLSKSATPGQVQAGTSVTYKINLTNLGPGTATNVSLNESTPANTTFRSIDAPAGWVCTTPAQGAAGNITCTAPAILPGTTNTFTLVVRVSAATANGTVIKNTVKVTSATTDPNSSNDSASATVTVTNSCTINCPPGITRNSDPNQCGATVTYSAPIGSGACGGIGCLPPSGSFFQRGTTTVICSASSGPGCSFTVTVNDQQPPTITCPGPVTAQETTAGSGTAMVNYSLPATSDNCQGGTTVCSPPAGSLFPVGNTPVRCTATDAGGNSASCSFNVIVQGGPPILSVTIPGDGPAIVFGGTRPVPVGRKPVKDKNSPCSIFTVENKGFTPVEIILDSVVRTGSDVDSRRISDASDGGLYSVRRLLSGGGDVLVPIGGSVVIGIGERVDFCVKFTPTLPVVPASSGNIPASQVLADKTTSRVTFRVVRGNSFSINTIANIASDLVLIDPVNTRRPAVVTFERIDDEFVLTFSLFDANQDVQKMKVELLDAGGSVVATFDIDLVVPVRERNLVKGQSFTVVQKFTGANDNPQVTAVRLTVTDLLNTVTATVNLTGRVASALVQQNELPSVVDLPRQRIGR